MALGLVESTIAQDVFRILFFIANPHTRTTRIIMTHFSARHKVVSLVLVLMCLSVATTSLPSCTTVQAADSSVMRRDEEVQFWELGGAEAPSKGNAPCSGARGACKCSSR
eukprot:gene3652-2587_t